MKKVSVLILMSATLLVLFSCKEEEPDNTIKIGLVTKVFKNNTMITEILYNNSNRPEKMSYYGVTGYPDGYATYEFGDDTLVDKIKVYSKQGVLTSFSTLLYDANMRLMTKKYYQIKGGNEVLMFSEAFFYNTTSQLINFSEFDSTGNVKYLTEMVYDTVADPSEVKYRKADNSYVGSLYYKYDSKPNAFALYNSKIGTSHPYNKHNITKITSSLTPVNGKVIFNFGNTSLEVALYNSTFEYDINKLPTKEIRNYLSGTSETYTYQYK